MKFWPEAQIY